MMLCGMGSPSRFPAGSRPPLTFPAPLSVRGRGDRSRLGQRLRGGEANVPEVPRK